MPVYIDTLGEAGEVIPAADIIKIKTLNLPDDNWYRADEANDTHREWGTSWGNLFALVGARWLPVEAAPTPSERLAAALNRFDAETAEIARAERAESEWGWTSPSGSEARCWWNDCASSHPSLDAGLTEAMNMDDGTIAAIDGWAVTPVEGRWVVLGEASDYIDGEE